MKTNFQVINRKKACTDGTRNGFHQIVWLKIFNFERLFLGLARDHKQDNLQCQIKNFVPFCMGFCNHFTAKQCMIFRFSAPRGWRVSSPMIPNCLVQQLQHFVHTRFCCKVVIYARKIHQECRHFENFNPIFRPNF